MFFCVSKKFAVVVGTVIHNWHWQGLSPLIITIGLFQRSTAADRQLLRQCFSIFPSKRRWGDQNACYDQLIHSLCSLYNYFSQLYEMQCIINTALMSFLRTVFNGFSGPALYRVPPRRGGITEFEYSHCGKVSFVVWIFLQKRKQGLRNTMKKMKSYKYCGQILTT